MLIDTLNADLKAAMYAKDSLKTGMIRMVVSEAKRKRGDNQAPTDAELWGAIKALITSAEEVLKVTPGGTEGGDKALAEIAILRAYLPQEATEADIRAVVAQGRAEGVAGAKVIGYVLKHFKDAGRLVDGAKVKAVVEAEGKSA